MKKKKNARVFALSVDFEGGDGPSLFRISNENGAWQFDKKWIAKHFPDLLFASYPPPVVKIVDLSAAQWAKAEKRGKEMA